MAQETYSYRPLSQEEKAAFQAFLDCGFHMSFPYNHDPHMLAAIEPYFPYIGEVYAPLHPAIFPSLRIWDLQQTPDEYLKVLCGVAAELKSRGIWLNIVLNMGARTDIPRQPVFRHLEKLNECGLIRVTLSDLYWAEIIRQPFPDISLGSSISADVRSQAAAQIWRDWVGADFIVVSEIINKNLRRIRQIRDLGLKIKIVMDDKCIPECPLQMRHVALLGSQNSRWSEEPETLDVNSPCLQLRHSLPPWHWAKKEILPFSLPRYKGILDSVKITDRRASTENNIINMRNYLAMKSDVHPVIGYRETEEAFERISSCDRNCAQCGWCAANIKMAGDRGDYIRDELSRLPSAGGTATQWGKSGVVIDFSRESLASAPSTEHLRATESTLADRMKVKDSQTAFVEAEPEISDTHVKEEIAAAGVSSSGALIECPPELEGAESLRWWSLRLRDDWDHAELAGMLRHLVALFGDIIREEAGSYDGLNFRRIAQNDAGGLNIEFRSGDDLIVVSIAEGGATDALQHFSGYSLSFHADTRASEGAMERMKAYITRITER